jgi:isocitrate dehydrogenase
VNKNTPITIAKGDGIGPEIMDATLEILEAAGAALDIEEVKIGKSVYEDGVTSGIPADAWESLRRTRVFLKAPITTPQGKGYKSLNVTLRKTLGLFANTRPCLTFRPFIESRFDNVDCVVIRENEEDTYAGIEHRQTQEVTQCLKLITKPGSERIIRYAFEFAKQNGRKRVTCMSKDNIMKITDGLFHETFNQVAKEYPEIETDHKIIDIGSALIADSPQDFDVVVTLNLYGDIISDILAQVCGSVGIAGSSNIGADFAMFEAIHGSAPDIVGQDIANPSALLNGAVMLLKHIGQPEVAAKIQNAWLKTLEDGIHTGDIYSEANSQKKVGTQAFKDAVIANLGKEPVKLAKAVVVEGSGGIHLPEMQKVCQKKELVGVDLFLDWDEDDRDANQLGERINAVLPAPWKLKMITNRGVKVYPDGFPETFCTDHWRCRFLKVDESEDPTLENQNIVELMTAIGAASLDIVKTENLYLFDGERGYTLGQGE